MKEFLQSTFFCLVTVCFLLIVPAPGETWKELLDRADSLSDAGHQDSTIMIGLKALALAEKKFGKEDTVVALIFYRMSVYNHSKANYEEAESLYKQALAIREKVLGPEHPNIAKSNPQSSILKKISILLPFYLHDDFRSLLEDALGFRILWADNRHDTEKIVDSSTIDIALEWQQGREDYPIRDILRKCNKKKVPILLFLNWDGKLPPDFENLGYAGYLNVPPRVAELKKKIYKVLPESTKALLKQERWLEE